MNFNTVSGEQVLIEKYIETFSGPPPIGWGITKLENQIAFYFTPWDGNILANKWHHVALTRSSNWVKLYLNGALLTDTDTAITLNVDSTSSLKLGHRGNPTDTPGSIDERGFYLNGLIDEVEIYNRALSDSEIKAIYNAGSKGKCKFMTVSIDIKPGSCPNPINVKSKGVLPMAVLGTAEFDVSTIDPATILLSREEMDGGVAPLRWSYEDVGTPFEGELCNCHDLYGDGYIDLSLKFDTKALVTILELEEVTENTLPLRLTGNLKEEFGGNPIKGQDCIRVLNKAK